MWPRGQGPRKINTPLYKDLNHVMEVLSSRTDSYSIIFFFFLSFLFSKFIVSV